MAIGLDANPASLSNTATRMYEVGTLYYYQGAYYRYARFVDAVTYAAGHVLEWAVGVGCSRVTNDRAGGSSRGRVPAGVCLCAMTQDYWGFFQVAGVGRVALLTDESVAAGEYLVSDVGVDGGADTMANGEEEQCFAFTIAADAGSALAAGNYTIIRLM